MFNCTALGHALPEWQNNYHVQPKTSKSKLYADRSDRSNYFNHKNDGGKNASCCAASCRKLFTSPAIADMYTFLIQTRKTQPESYEQSMYKNTFPTVKYQIQ